MHGAGRSGTVTLASDLETAQRLNHVEMVYRPGERDLATRVFELLGMRVIDNGGEWLFALVDPSVGDARNNACYASQMTAEQWTLEQTLTSAMARGDSEVGTAAQVYADTVRAEPQHSFHFAIRYLERETFDATLDRFRAADDDPVLAERAALLGIYDPSEPGAYAPGMFQAFVRTDVVAGGLLALGQLIELQWHLPNS
jgi:hypothetical protein